MADAPTMIRPNMPAANADVMGEDTPAQDAARNDEAKPGKGINQAGFVKDKDGDKPSGDASD